jgi:hypothetical protein
MSNLDHVLNEIRALSPADLRELKSYLEVAIFTNQTPASDQPMSVPAETADEFESDLDAVTFGAPPLRSSFSRADIYNDHD